MKRILSLIAIITLFVLLIYSALNLYSNPVWMIAMIAYSTGFIQLVYKDMKADIKIKAFTMIELITVITIMAVLLTIGLKGLKADTSKAALIQVGENLKLYNSKALSEQTTYRIEITAKRIEVYNSLDELIHAEGLKHEVTFYTPPTKPTVTEESVVINKRGELEDRSSELKLWVSKRPLRMNMFTGHVVYY